MLPDNIMVLPKGYMLTLDGATERAPGPTDIGDCLRFAWADEYCSTHLLPDLPEASIASARIFHQCSYSNNTNEHGYTKHFVHFTNILFILQTSHEVLTSLHLAPGPKSTATM